MPGTTDTWCAPILEQASGKKAGADFGVGMNPEFLAEGDAVKDFMDPDRIVVGGIDERSTDVLAALYAMFRDTPRRPHDNAHRGDDQVHLERASWRR